MEQKLQIGDVVVLKSGSPKLTVSKIIMSGGMLGVPLSYTGRVEVSWFEGNKAYSGEYHQDSFDKV